MKKSLAFLPFLLLIFTFSDAAQTIRTTFVESNLKPSYNDLLIQLKGGDVNIDFKALRMKYTETKEYSPKGLDPQTRDRMYKAINEKKFEEARSIAETVLKTDYVDLSAHLVAGMASEALGDTAKFEFHKAVFTGLMSSIVDGADGTSAKTAYQVISIPEEYAVLDYFKLKSSGQSLANDPGHKYDVLTVTEANSSETAKMYFSVVQKPARK
jgi:hypothetical protein